MSKARTRHASSSTLSDFLGPGKELVPSQVSTLRAALQLGLYLQQERETQKELDKINYPLSELMRDVTVKVMGQWEIANPLFQSPIISLSRSMEQRLLKEWERAKLAARNKFGKMQKTELEKRLDMLLDPLFCTCSPIVLCKEIGCQGPKATPPCNLGAHLPSCSCPREKKIPQIELQFVKSQREKKSEKDGMQMSLEDFKEDARQNKAASRKEKEKQGIETQTVKMKTKEIELQERVKEHESVILEEEGGGGKRKT